MLRYGLLIEMPDSFTDEPIIIHSFWWLDDCIWPLDRHSLTSHMFIWQPFPSTRLRVQFCLFSFKSVYFSWIKLSRLSKLWVAGGLSFPINFLLCLMLLLLLTRQQSASNFGKKIMCVHACVFVCIMCVCVCACLVINPIQSWSARISSFQWHKK